jgi:hypothetical protein
MAGVNQSSFEDRSNAIYEDLLKKKLDWTEDTQQMKDMHGKA